MIGKIIVRPRQGILQIYKTIMFFIDTVGWENMNLHSDRHLNGGQELINSQNLGTEEDMICLKLNIFYNFIYLNMILLYR